MADLLNLQVMMFLLMATGVLLAKLGIVSRSGRETLTDLIINVILPCNIIQAFSKYFDKSVLLSGLQVLAIAIVLQLFSILISNYCYGFVPKRQRAVLQYGTVCSNASFLGNPIAEGLYGSLGLLYASIYLIPLRITMWTAGMSYYTDNADSKMMWKKLAKHPCIIATVAGILMMLTSLKLPECLERTINSLGSCTTALTMLLIGMILADADVKGMVSKITILYAFVRLIGIPAVVLIGCKLFAIEALSAGVVTILAAMPAGSTTAILAAKYQADEKFASQCIVFTTLLSMIMLPIWSIILQRVF